MARGRRFARRGTQLAVALAVLLALASVAPAMGGRTAGAADAGVEAVGIEPATSVGPTTALRSGATTDERTTGDATDERATETAGKQSADETVEIETEGFDPEYDPTTVLERVERLRDLSAVQGITLHEYDRDEERPHDVEDAFGAIRPVGAQTLQLYSNASTERRAPLGYTVERQAAVHIYLLNDSDLEEYGVSQEVVLAHEFVHALQFQRDLLTSSRSQFRSAFPEWTTDSRLVATAIVEGDAMWVTEQYARRYGESDYSVAEYNRTLARAAWPHSVAGTPYYYGYEFYERAGSSPAERSAAIESPPESTAELLHPTERGERAPGTDVPDAPDIPASAELTRYHTDTVGELVVRHALRMNDLSFRRAAAAADGWASDRMYYYAAAGAAGPATHWVTVWESDREAREFADAWREMLAGNGARPVGETLFVPMSDHAPGVHYVVERDGATVSITAAEMPRTAVALADAAGKPERTAEPNATSEPNVGTAESATA